MSWGLLGKSIVIALCAALTASAYLIAFSTLHPNASSISPATAGVTVMVALFGSFTIGWPVALFVYFFSARHLAYSLTTVALVAVLSGIMMVLASYVLAREGGVLALGIPAFIAALTYGLLGWWWIFRPLRHRLELAGGGDD